MFKQEIIKALNSAGVNAEGVLVAQDEGDKGEFSLPCFRFSKELRRSPQAIAESLAQALDLDFIDKTEAVNGYLNIFLDKAVFAKRVLGYIAARAEDIGKSRVGEGKTICIDYSSINIAKPFHIGHLSSTVIGGALYRIYKRLGYNVVGINHLGDWGTQFGKLIYAYKTWSSKAAVESGGIRELLNLYVRYHEQAEKDPSLDNQARQWFLKIEQGDSQALEMFDMFREITLTEVKHTYNQLGVHFDSWDGESFYNDKLDGVYQLLTERNLLTESDGAEIVKLDDFDMPPCLIKRSDGASLYATRDLAAILYRKAHYNFDKCLYVVAYQQNLHFQQVFKTAELMGVDTSGLVHVPFGMVSLEEGTMSTRKGKVVFLQEVLDKAVEKTLSIINQKNPELSYKEMRAQQIGRGAVIYSALSNQRIKDVTFSFDRVLSFEGETGPYIQYTHARACSVLRRASDIKDGDDLLSNADYSALSDEASIALIKQLSRFEDCVVAAAERFEPSIISKQLIDISRAFNKFYIDNKIIVEDNAVRNARLLLAKATKDILKAGLELILLHAPEEM